MGVAQAQLNQWSKRQANPRAMPCARAGGADMYTRRRIGQREQQEEQPRRNDLGGADWETKDNGGRRGACSFLICGCESIYPLTLIINFYSLLASVIFWTCRMCRLRELKFHYTYSGGTEGLKRRNNLFGYLENVSYI